MGSVCSYVRLKIHHIERSLLSGKLPKLDLLFPGITLLVVIMCKISSKTGVLYFLQTVIEFDK